MDYTEKKLRRLNGYKGIIINVTLDEIELPGGHHSYREIVEHPGGVCILPVDDEGNCYLVQQYRYAGGAHLLEAPAGKRDPGEEPIKTAARELGEETGFTAGRLIDLGYYYSSPGFTNETIYIYLARELQRGDAHPDEDEFLDLIKMPLSELLDMTCRGEIHDGKTAIAALQADRWLREHPEA